MTRSTGPSTGRSTLRAVLSDIDGTLVRSDKSLSDDVVAAVRELRAAGIAFTIASARPALGLRSFVERLGLDESVVDGTDVPSAPMAAFNGGNIVSPSLQVLDAFRVPPALAREAVDALFESGMDAWVFTHDQWRICNREAHYIDLETRTLGYGPTYVETFQDDDFAAVDKILGTSSDHAALAAAGDRLKQRFAGKLSIGLSQPYYLDITHPKANKGEAARAIAAHLGIPLEELAVIGDMSNDLPMFDVAGFAIAMGQSTPDIQQRAHAVTRSNDDDGVAHAIRTLLIPRGPGK